MQSSDPLLEQPAQADGLPWSLVRCAVGAILWAVVIWMFLVSIPKSARLFDDFRMAIPYATQAVIHLRWAIPLLAIVSFAVSVYVRTNWAWLWTLIALPGILIVAIFASLYFPIMKLVNALPGGTSDWWEYFL